MNHMLSFEKKGVMKQHVEAKHPHNCLICRKSCKSEEGVQDHMKMKHKSRGAGERKTNKTSTQSMRKLTARWPGQPSVPTDPLVELRVPPPPSSLLPYSANVKLTARLSALAVRKSRSHRTWPSTSFIFYSHLGILEIPPYLNWIIVYNKGFLFCIYKF